MHYVTQGPSGNKQLSSIQIVAVLTQEPKSNCKENQYIQGAKMRLMLNWI